MNTFFIFNILVFAIILVYASAWSDYSDNYDKNLNQKEENEKNYNDYSINEGAGNANNYYDYSENKGAENANNYYDYSENEGQIEGVGNENNYYYYYSENNDANERSRNANNLYDYSDNHDKNKEAVKINNYYDYSENERARKAGNSYDYYESYEENYDQYEEYATEEDANLGGEHHLVGGKESTTKEVPFIAITRVTGFCTGSLISPKWVVTAAHCTQMIHNDNAYEINSCVYNTLRKIPYFCRKTQTICQCKRLHDESVEYSGFNKTFSVWLGLKDRNEIRNYWRKEGEEHQIERIIRHEHTYAGSHAGNYQGYDISLVLLKDESERLFACLPSPNFNDNVVSKVAGYGVYHRKERSRDGKDVCQTDGAGQMRFHYCKEKGHGMDVCKQSSPPQSKFCKPVLKNLDIGTYVDPITKKIHQKEVMVFEQNGDKIKPWLSCFDDKIPHEHGWCYTEDDFYHSKNKIDLDRVDHSYKQAWGYCSDDCFQNDEDPDSGVLRLKDHIDVLDDELCNHFLKISLADKNVVIPQILCVGYKKNIEVDSYLIKGDSEFNLAKLSNQSHFGLHYADYFGKGFFVAAGGVCMGDSGGPLYLEKTYGGRSRYIVTGVVSGGKGKAGFCGGVNNPTHYVRMKKLTPWIQNHVEDVCKD